MHWRRQRRADLAVIASLGGHLHLLDAVSAAFSDREVIWITSAGVRADQLRAAGSTVCYLPPLDKRSLGLRALLSGALLAARLRPRVVVTSGAGIAVPFGIVARALGARLLFIETMARVSSGSQTGRIFQRLGASMFVQWPALRDTYPAAVVCRPLLLEQRHAAIGDKSLDEGTLVSLGSHHQPFHRLMNAVAIADRDGLLPHPITIQHGSTPVPDELRGGAIPFLDPADFERVLRSSRLVISHGGAGVLAQAITYGKRPVVIERKESQGEHVDDHQEDLIRELDRRELVLRVDTDRISSEVVAAAMDGPVPTGSDFAGVDLVEALKRAL